MTEFATKRGNMTCGQNPQDSPVDEKRAPIHLGSLLRFFHDMTDKSTLFKI